MRKKFLTQLYLHSQKLYTSLFKNRQPWQVTRQDLLNYEEHTLGHQLGLFLLKHDFELIPKVEQHDVYHVLTGYSISVEDEIALQYLCFGNGKRSLYLAGAILIGTIVLPEHLGHYLRSYRRGRRLASFTHYEYRSLLLINFGEFWKMIHCGTTAQNPHLLNLPNSLPSTPCRALPDPTPDPAS